MTKLEIGVMLEQKVTFFFIMVTFFIMKNRCYCSTTGMFSIAGIPKVLLKPKHEAQPRVMTA